MTKSNAIKRNKSIYLYLKSKIDFKSNDLTTIMKSLSLIRYIAHFAWRNHPGCFFDAEIEMLLLNYGRELVKYVDTQRITDEIELLFHKSSENSILHVATEIGTVGGHTRIINQMIKRGKDKKQGFVLTDMKVNLMPEWFKNGVENNSKIFSLSNYQSLLEKAYALRVLSKYYNKIILYHHPYDVIPLLAFAEKSNIPVAIENHAHSWFWLGVSIGDLVFSHTKYHNKFTKKYRKINNCYYFPFIQSDNLENLPSSSEKKKAKEFLGIGNDKTLILSVGSREKYIPNSEYNFIKIIDNILQNNLNVVFIVVGISPNDKLVNELKYSDRIQFFEYVTDLTNFYLASDICLESMPQVSYGVQFLSTLIGLSCPFPKYGKAKVFKVHVLHQSKLYRKYFEKEMDENEFYEKINLFINNSEIRLSIAKEIREIARKTRTDKLLFQNLMKMYEEIGLIPHAPQNLKETIFYNDEENFEIAERSQFQDWNEIVKFLNEKLRIGEFWKFLQNYTFSELTETFDFEEQLEIITAWNKSNSVKNYEHQDNILSDYENTILAQAEMQIKLNNLEKAETMLNNLLIENNKNFDALNDLAVVYIMEEKYDKALNFIVKVLTLSPTNEIAIGNIEYLESLIPNN